MSFPQGFRFRRLSGLTLMIQIQNSACIFAMVSSRILQQCQDSKVVDLDCSVFRSNWIDNNSHQNVFSTRSPCVHFALRANFTTKKCEVCSSGIGGRCEVYIENTWKYTWLYVTWYVLIMRKSWSNGFFGWAETISRYAKKIWRLVVLQLPKCCLHGLILIYYTIPNDTVFGSCAHMSMSMSFWGKRLWQAYLRTESIEKPCGAKGNAST